MIYLVRVEFTKEWWWWIAVIEADHLNYTRSWNLISHQGTQKTSLCFCGARVCVCGCETLPCAGTAGCDSALVSCGLMHIIRRFCVCVTCRRHWPARGQILHIHTCSTSWSFHTSFTLNSKLQPPLLQDVETLISKWHDLTNYLPRLAALTLIQTDVDTILKQLLGKDKGVSGLQSINVPIITMLSQNAWGNLKCDWDFRPNKLASCLLVTENIAQTFQSQICLVSVSIFAVLTFTSQTLKLLLSHISFMKMQIQSFC